MAPVPRSLRLPRPGVAWLVALIGGVAIAVELLVPAPRAAAKLRPAVACPPQLDGDRVRLACRAATVAIEIDRSVELRYAPPPPLPLTADRRTATPRIRNLCGGGDAVARAR